MNDLILKELESHIKTCNNLTKIFGDIEKVSKSIIHALEKNGKIILFGNGGSASDSQHIAAEFVGRYKLSRTGLAAISLNTDTSSITAIGNDFGYDEVFKRQLEAIMNPDDVVIGISTSGNSENVVRALEYAKNNNVTSYGFSGSDGGKMNNHCDLNIVVPSNDTPRIQEMHIFIGHTICHIVDIHFSR